MAYGTGIGLGPPRHTSITELRRVASHIVVPKVSGAPAPTLSAKAASQKGITSAVLVPKNVSPWPARSRSSPQSRLLPRAKQRLVEMLEHHIYCCFDSTLPTGSRFVGRGDHVTACGHDFSLACLSACLETAWRLKAMAAPGPGVPELATHHLWLCVRGQSALGLWLHVSFIHKNAFPIAFVDKVKHAVVSL